MNGRWLGLAVAGLLVFATIPVQAGKGPCQEGSIKERLACLSKQLGKMQGMAKQGPAGPVGPAGSSSEHEAAPSAEIEIAAAAASIR